MSFTGLLNQSITLAAQSSYGADGEPSFATGSTVKCRFEKDTKRILLPNHQVLTIDALCFVAGDTTVSTDDKVTFGSDTYKVADIHAAVDDVGNTHHLELRLVKWP